MKFKIITILSIFTLQSYAINIQDVFLIAPDSIYRNSVFHSTNRKYSLITSNIKQANIAHNTSPVVQSIVDIQNAYIKIDYSINNESPLIVYLEAALFYDNKSNCYYVINENYYHGPDQDIYFSIYLYKNNRFIDVKKSVLPLNYENVTITKLSNTFNNKELYAYGKTIGTNIYEYQYILPQKGTTILVGLCPNKHWPYIDNNDYLDVINDFCSIKIELLWDKNNSKYNYGKIYKKKENPAQQAGGAEK